MSALSDTHLLLASFIKMQSRVYLLKQNPNRKTADLQLRTCEHPLNMQLNKNYRLIDNREN